MAEELVSVREVRVGDRVLAADGVCVEIVAIGPGMPLRTIELRWRGGWQALRPSAKVTRVAGGVRAPIS